MPEIHEIPDVIFRLFSASGAQNQEEDCMRAKTREGLHLTLGRCKSYQGMEKVTLEIHDSPESALSGRPPVVRITVGPTPAGNGEFCEAVEIAFPSSAPINVGGEGKPYHLNRFSAILSILFRVTELIRSAQFVAKTS